MIGVVHNSCFPAFLDFKSNSWTLNFTRGRKIKKIVLALMGMQRIITMKFLSPFKIQNLDRLGCHTCIEIVISSVII